ncbi:helix-turn-helix transcriptional regulator [bacterium]|nr:helix-turn-helix transcriptional regulator [bacterium]
MDIKVLLGKRIREYRQKYNYTQSQLAELLGIDDKHLSRIELGKNMPNPVLLEKLANLFKIELKDLFELSHLEQPEIIRKKLQEIINELPTDQLLLTYKYVKTFVI